MEWIACSINGDIQWTLKHVWATSHPSIDGSFDRSLDRSVERMKLGSVAGEVSQLALPLLATILLGLLRLQQTAQMPIGFLYHQHRAEGTINIKAYNRVNKMNALCIAEYKHDALKLS